ncbi:hypothetical protein KQI22_01550 [Kineothrix sp. MSJ-39]|uniref:hypothetical protein n=1 Tax=Kineothrix sp. MSJ-39 TaxID=2841533 RepID=UPI001C1095CB|nr:hypothetical protein [Kineothrix sp. MSJ-39]MBU5428750.1 hypothetical protein [Kineothrix sp. MSJ-39]
MTNIALLASVLPFFIFGFYIMKKVDQFISGNENRMREEIKMQEPSSVILSGDLPLMEIDKEIDIFRKKHPNFEIILKDMNWENNGINH